MALTIRYQTAHQTLRVVDRVEDVPKDATIIWYDFDVPNEKENE